MKLAIVGKGGVGKTTLAASLARRLAATGQPTIAVDADPDGNINAHRDANLHTHADLGLQRTRRGGRPHPVVPSHRRGKLYRAVCGLGSQLPRPDGGLVRLGLHGHPDFATAGCYITVRFYLAKA